MANLDIPLQMVDGIVVGVDQTQEWILPWWWHHYAKTNTHPVTFVDFGLTAPMKQWCKVRGNYIHLSTHVFAAEKEAVPENLIADWETQFGPRVWQSRMAWFKKPLACLKSPYDRTIWLDIDCEIRCSIAPLFETCEHPAGVAMAKDQVVPFLYNSGVIVFQRNLKLLNEWAENCYTRNHEFGGDQEILSQMIAEKNLSIAELSNLWNWSRCSGENKDALIIHWHGDNGRMIIRHQMEGLCLAE